jgi:hypothetical protein
MEVCLISPQCSKRHKPSASDKFKGLSLQHWQSVIAAKELCVHCLRHSNLDAVTLKECTRRKTPPHWLGSEAAPGEGSAAGGGKGGQANVCLPHQHHGEYIDRFARGDLQCTAGHAVQHNTTDVDYRPEHSHRGQGRHTGLCWM